MGRFFVHRLLIWLMAAATVTIIGFGSLRLSGDLGGSLFADDPVIELISDRMGATVQLALMSPGLAIFLLVMAINMMGDGIRDITAPEGRN